ncbi:hypothetical protein [Anoxybacteroides rupiense]|uniref:Uncharacterized protein n=1 Tax=Anoxybacteroides rupiense TaxID=311460 RepID=A0ABD5IR65_9BACL|nr:hypothetical protein [Anoxybacillus rupiensis]
MPLPAHKQGWEAIRYRLLDHRRKRQERPLSDPLSIRWLVY